MAPPAASTPAAGHHPPLTSSFPNSLIPDPTSVVGDASGNNGVRVENTRSDPGMPVYTEAIRQAVIDGVRNFFNNEGASENNAPRGPTFSDNIQSDNINPSLPIPVPTSQNNDQVQQVTTDTPVSESMNNNNGNGYYTRREQAGQGYGQQRQAGQFAPAPVTTQPPPRYSQGQQQQPALQGQGGFPQSQYGQQHGQQHQQQYGANSQGNGIGGQPQNGQAPGPIHNPARSGQPNNGYTLPGQGNGVIPGLMDLNLPNNSQYQQVNPNDQLNSQYRQVNDQLRDLHTDSEYYLPPPPQVFDDYGSFDGSNASNSNASGKKKKTHRGGARQAARKAMAAAKGNSNPDSTILPFGPAVSGQSPGQVGGAASLAQGGGPSLQAGLASSSTPSLGHELPEDLIQGLVNMEDPSIPKIRHLLQGSVPPELLPAAIEINNDLMNLRSMINAIHDQVTQGTMNREILENLATAYHPYHLRAVNAVRNRVLGIKFNMYASEIAKFAQDVILSTRSMFQRSGAGQNPLEWSMQPGPPNASQDLMQQTSGSTPYNPPPPPSTSTHNSTSKEDEFVTPGLTPGLRPGHQDVSPIAPAMINPSHGQGSIGPTVQGPTPSVVNEENEIIMGNQDFQSSNLSTQINGMGLEEVSQQIDRRQSELANATGTRARTFQQVYKQALIVRKDWLIQTQLDRQRQQQAEAAAAAAAAGSTGASSNGLNQSDPSNNGSNLDHVRRAQEELSVAIQPRTDPSGPAVDIHGAGASLQNSRQAGQSPSSCGSNSTVPMDTSTPAAAPGTIVGSASGQHAGTASQADLTSATGKGPGPAVPMPPGTPVAGPSVTPAPYAPSAPEQGPVSGDSYQPFDNRSVATISSATGPYPNVSFQVSQSQNRSAVSPTFPANSHPNCANLMNSVNKVKASIQTQNRSMLSNAPSTAASTSSSPSGKRVN